MVRKSRCTKTKFSGHFLVNKGAHYTVKLGFSGQQGVCYTRVCAIHRRLRLTG